MRRIGAAGAGLLLLIQAFLPNARGQVHASLVSSETSVQPGRPFTVALHLVHEAGWHTYWLNPGTGIATTLEWKLPPGWKAGEIQWPSPEVLTDDKGGVTGNGYEGDLLLPVTLNPPADLRPGSRVTLAATADWLMCRDVCKPGEEAVSLSLPVAENAPAPDPQWGARISGVIDALPRNDASWSLTATRQGKTVVLRATPAAANAASHPPRNPHFFSDDNLVAYEQPQAVADDGRGGIALTLAISPDGPVKAVRLLGVLTSGNGWAPDGSRPGLRVEVPLGEGLPAASQAGAGLGAAAGSSRGLAATLLLAFAGGLILNLMPCVFPVLGIKVLGFVNQAGKERSKVVLHGLVFGAGVVLSFWVLVGILIALRAGGDQLGWGFQLQSPVFVFGLSAVMLVFALNLSGVFEFGLGATAIGSGLQSRTGLGGSFFTGVLATLVATPCSAPFLAPALGAALTLSPVEAFLVFTVIAIGLSTPYLLLSIFPGAVRVLPRPGAWMETFKQFMAFPIYATVGYLLWVIAGQVSEYGLLGVFIGLVLIAMGAWAYGRWHGVGASSVRARFGLLAAALLIALGAWTGWPKPAAPTDITWEKWSPEALGKLRGDGRIVYVDFTARWCATCQANKRVVFHSDEVLRTFREKGIATLRGDWTNKDPQISAELARYNRNAVPFDLIWLPGKNEPVILPEILTPGIVLRAVGAGG
jgi:thiol:disulfide interchange protein DsbD